MSGGEEKKKKKAIVYEKIKNYPEYNEIQFIIIKYTLPNVYIRGKYNYISVSPLCMSAYCIISIPLFPINNIIIAYIWGYPKTIVFHINIYIYFIN